MLEQVLHVAARPWGRAAARSHKCKGSADWAQGRQFRKSEEMLEQRRGVCSSGCRWDLQEEMLSAEMLSVEKGAHMLTSAVIGTVVGVQRTLADVCHFASLLSDTVRNT